MGVVRELPPELARRLKRMEQEAYSCLVAGNFSEAEKIYKQQYEIFRAEEQRLPVDKKYHKGSPLHNWVISLLLQKKTLFGFKKIALTYIEDLLNFRMKCRECSRTSGIQDHEKLPSYIR